MLPGTQKPAHTLHVLMSLIKTPHEQLLTLNFDRMDGKGTLTGFQQGIETVVTHNLLAWPCTTQISAKPFAEDFSWNKTQEGS